jgi:hypothetical protein
MTEEEAKKIMERIRKRMSGKAAPKKSDESDSRGGWPIPL